MTSQEIAKRIDEHARWLASVRVSQDGWAEVVDRSAKQQSDLAEAINSGRLIAHITNQPRYKTS